MSNVTIPRSQTPITIGGPPMSPDWYRFMHDMTKRVGGAVSDGIEELQDQIQTAAASAADAESIARAMASRGLAVKAAQRVEVPIDLLRSLLARVATLERKVRDIEELPI